MSYVSFKQVLLGVKGSLEGQIRRPKNPFLKKASVRADEEDEEGSEREHED